MKKGLLLFFVVIAILLWRWYQEGGVGAVIFIGLVILVFSLLFWIRNSRQAGNKNSEENLVAEIQYKRGKDLIVLKKYSGDESKQDKTDDFHQSNKKNSNAWEDLERQHWESGWEDNERRKEK